jgi:exodeoxyribonuclease VII small subunit
VESKPDIDEMTYEQARDELVLIVAKLEAGDVTLEESLALWERGEALATRCQHVLEGARERVARHDADSGDEGPDAAESSEGVPGDGELA